MHAEASTDRSSRASEHSSRDTEPISRAIIPSAFVVTPTEGILYPHGALASKKRRKPQVCEHTPVLQSNVFLLLDSVMICSDCDAFIVTLLLCEKELKLSVCRSKTVSAFLCEAY